MYNGSIKELAVSLFDDESLSDDDIKELKEIFKDNEVIIRLFDKNSKRIRENGDTVYAVMYYYRLKIGVPAVYGVEKIDYTMKASPVLKNGITYVPAEVINIIQAESGLLSRGH